MSLTVSALMHLRCWAAPSQWRATLQRKQERMFRASPTPFLPLEKLREEFGQATFFTATDGNHGRGVAWAANRLGQKAVVHMPKGSTTDPS